MRYMIALALLLAACSPGGAYRDTSIPMRSVDALDTQTYLGRWYEIARFPNSFEDGCRNVTATYGLLDNGRLSVTNRCEKDSGRRRGRRIGPDRRSGAVEGESLSPGSRSRAITGCWTSAKTTIWR